MPLLRVVGHKVPWSPFEPANELSVMNAIAQRHGLHSDFITFSKQSVAQAYDCERSLFTFPRM